MDKYRRYPQGGSSYGSSAAGSYASSSTARPTAPSYSSSAGSSSRTRFNPFEETNARSGGGSYGQSYASKGKRFDEEDRPEDEEEDIEGIKRQIYSVKQDTLASTRNAVQKIRETEAIAEKTLTTLGQQGGKLLKRCMRESIKLSII
jgi:hypothetical protein